jgi:hypothetical protein
MVHVLCRVFERRSDIVILQIWKIREDIRTARTAREQVENILHPHPQAADTGPAAKNVRINGDAIEVAGHFLPASIADTIAKTVPSRICGAIWSSGRIYRPHPFRDFLAPLAFDEGDAVLVLEIHPELRVVTKIPPEAHRGIGRDRTPSVEDIGNADGRNAQIQRQPVGAET